MKKASKSKQQPTTKIVLQLTPREMRQLRHWLGEIDWFCDTHADDLTLDYEGIGKLCYALYPVERAVGHTRVRRRRNPVNHDLTTRRGVEAALSEADEQVRLFERDWRAAEKDAVYWRRQRRTLQSQLRRIQQRAG